jgi:Family of unknown function (DUF5320)
MENSSRHTVGDLLQAGRHTPASAFRGEIGGRGDGSHPPEGSGRAGARGMRAENEYLPPNLPSRPQGSPAEGRRCIHEWQGDSDRRRQLRGARAAVSLCPARTRLADHCRACDPCPSPCLPDLRQRSCPACRSACHVRWSTRSRARRRSTGKRTGIESIAKIVPKRSEIGTPRKTKWLGGNKMPFGNRKGPQGQGPRTGRRAGYCSNGGQPGYVTAPGRRPGQGGAGRGFGLRSGWKAGRSAERPR